MTWKRIAAGFAAAGFLIAGAAFAGQDSSRAYAKRGADDAVEGGHRSGNHDEHQAQAPAMQPPSGQKDAGAALFESKCSACHALSRPLGTTKDREGWTATVKRMRNNGCQLTDMEAAAIVDHLVKVRGIPPP